MPFNGQVSTVPDFLTWSHDIPESFPTMSLNLDIVKYSEI